MKFISPLAHRSACEREISALVIALPTRPKQSGFSAIKDASRRALLPVEGWNPPSRGAGRAQNGACVPEQNGGDRLKEVF